MAYNFLTFENWLVPGECVLYKVFTVCSKLITYTCMEKSIPLGEMHSRISLRIILTQYTLYTSHIHVHIFARQLLFEVFLVMTSEVKSNAITAGKKIQGILTNVSVDIWWGKNLTMQGLVIQIKSVTSFQRPAPNRNYHRHWQRRRQWQIYTWFVPSSFFFRQ